ncbi:MAG: hypothetical protein ACJASP_001636 [Roseivirga sp.]
MLAEEVSLLDLVEGADPFTASARTLLTVVEDILPLRITCLSLAPMLLPLSMITLLATIILLKPPLRQPFPLFHPHGFPKLPANIGGQ